MTESEYEEWFKKYLSNIETIDNEFLIQKSQLKNMPKPFNIKKWVRWNTVVLMVSLILSFLAAAINGSWLYSWISNAFLNLAFGMIVSLIIFVFTNLRERNVIYLTDIIPLLRKRYCNLSEAYFQNSFRLGLYSQSGEWNCYYDAWHMLSNTCVVVNGFYLFLLKVIPNIKNFECYAENEIIKFNNQLLEIDAIFCEYYAQHHEITQKIHKKCEKAILHSYEILDEINCLTNQLEAHLFETKYGKSRIDL